MNMVVSDMTPIMFSALVRHRTVSGEVGRFYDSTTVLCHAIAMSGSHNCFLFFQSPTKLRSLGGTVGLTCFLRRQYLSNFVDVF